MTTIYHNAKCSKSREAFCLLEANKKRFRVVEYLAAPLTKEELTDLIKKLDIKPIQLMRKNEPIFEEKYKGKKLTSAQCIAAMIKHPILMERPIVVNGDKAIICRPPEKILEFIK